MVHDLEALPEVAAIEGMEIEDDPPVEDAIAVLESSYGWDLRGSLVKWADGLHPHLARLDGRPACFLGIQDEGGDGGVFMVGTIPEARGRGIAGALLTHSLIAARERGCDISTLQSTRMGEPVYARLGYRTHGRVNMWERRTG